MNVVLDPAFYDLELNNHPLREPYQDLRSIDITSDYRALYVVWFN